MSKNRPNVYHAGDYAGLGAKHGSFYYGYEETICGDCGERNCKNHDDAEHDWCFVAKIGADPIVIQSKNLGTSDKFDCVENLLLGIGWIMAKYTLVQVEESKP